MVGNERVRFCSQCKKNVYNLSAMTPREAEALLQETNANLCTRLFRRSDGTVLTEDCPVGLRAKITRLNWRIGWALAGAMGLAASAFGQSPTVLSGKVIDPAGAAIPNVSIKVTDPKSGKSVDTKTNAEGAFEITKLDAGTYKLQASAQWFELYTDSNVKLPASGEVRLKIQMSLPAIMGAVVAVVPVVASPSKSLDQEK